MAHYTRYFCGVLPGLTEIISTLPDVERDSIMIWPAVVSLRSDLQHIKHKIPPIDLVASAYGETLSLISKRYGVTAAYIAADTLYVSVVEQHEQEAFVPAKGLRETGPFYSSLSNDSIGQAIKNFGEMYRSAACATEKKLSVQRLELFSALGPHYKKLVESYLRD